MNSSNSNDEKILFSGKTAIRIIKGYNQIAYLDEDKYLVDEIETWDDDRQGYMFIRNCCYMHLEEAKKKLGNDFENLTLSTHYGLLFRYTLNLLNELCIDSKVIKNIHQIMYDHLVFLLNNINPLSKDKYIFLLNDNWLALYNKTIADLYDQKNNNLTNLDLERNIQQSFFEKDCNQKSQEIIRKEMNNWSEVYENANKKVANINFDILPNAIIEYDWDTRFLYLVTHLMINYKFGDDSKKIFNSPILYSYGSLISNTLSITNSFGIDDYEAIKIIPNFFIRLYDYLILGFGAKLKLHENQINLNQLQTFYRLKASDLTKEINQNIIPEDKDLSIIGLTFECFYNSRADKKADNGDLKGALQDYTESIKNNPNQVILYQKRAYIKGFLKDYKGAIDDYSSAISINDKNLKLNNIKSKLFLERGLNKFLIKDDDGAIDDYTLAIKFDENNAIAYHRRGIVLNFLDKPEKAIKDLNQAIKLDPDNISIIGSYFERGKYYLEKKQLSESIKDFSFFIDIYEKNVLSGDNLEREALGLCYVDRAHAYDSIGEYEKAFNDLRRSAELDCELAKKILNNQIQK